MQGVTPSSNPLYDGVPLEPAPSVRQVGTAAPHEWQPAAGSSFEPLLRSITTHSLTSCCCRASAGYSSQMPCPSTPCQAAPTCR